VVVGATGKQGGGAVDALLKDGTFAVRAITRDASSDKAKAIAQRGAEVVAADLNDTDSLIKAFTGAYGVFGVTDFWTAQGKETEHGKHLVDAAKATGVQHFVWSTLDGGHGVPHFDTKAAVDDYLKEKAVPHTLLFTGYFLENLGYLFFQKNAEGPGLAIQGLYATDGAFPVIAGRDVGKFALIAFKSPKKYIGGKILAAVDVISPRGVAAIVEKKYNIPVSLGPNGGVSLAAFYKFLDTHGNQMEEIWRNMKYFYEYSNCRGDPKDANRLISSEGLTLTSLEDILEELHAAGALKL